MFRALALASLAASTGLVAQESEERLAREVRALLSDRCFACHGPDGAHRKADLRLDTAAGARTVVAPGDLDASELWRRITHADPAERMPPAASGKHLDDDEIATLRRWIENGAAYTAHWSLTPLRRPRVPTTKDARWPINPIDRFVLARLEAENLTPAPDADPTTLARRLHFDLIGLPPSPDEVAAFRRAGVRAGIGRTLDDLFGSPEHAERMTVWWLDLVRYADTVGYHGDQEHAISPYRDYVLKAFRDNYPFDRFTTEQLAGDLLPEPTTEQRIASAYNRVLQTTHEGGAQPGEYLAKYAADRVRNVSLVWMGATMGCAECHDHKFDPYTQRDFYRLSAFFADIDEVDGFKAPNTTPTKRPPEIDVLGPFEAERIAALDDAIARARSASERSALLAERDELAARTRRVMVTVAVPPREVRVLRRGDWMDRSGEVVEPGVPAVLPALDTGARRATRLDLAQWLTSREHPQTARVLVNRLWQLFLGRGIASVDDSGAQGRLPTHPQLLDWLACELVDSGWDLRHVMRLILESRTWRMSSEPTAALQQRDPNNSLLARQGRWRLPAEFIRDTALDVAGLLVRELGGASARPYQPPGYYAHLNFPKREYRAHEDERQYRRGVYVHWQRMFLHPMLRAFDAPTREECTAKRSTSNTPLQALVLLNDPTFVEAARSLAARILREGGATDDTRLEWAWQLVLSRTPIEAERQVLLALVQSHRDQFAKDPEAACALLDVGLAPAPSDLDRTELAAWTSVARAILNLHETYQRS